jgi:outer membrane protein assembly factor BamB
MTGVKEWAKLRKALIQGESYNAEVNAHFGDTSNNEDREAVKNLCLIQGKDSMLIARQRQNFFYYQIKKIQNKPVIIGQPKIDYDAEVIYKPQIGVIFAQDFESVPKGKNPKTAKITWRLMDKTSETITNEDLNSWANKIYDGLFKDTRYSFDKGKFIAWYISKSEGLHLQIYCLSAEEGEKVVKKVLEVFGKEFNTDLLKITEPKRDNLKKPENIKVRGKDLPPPQWRPNIKVYAEYAYANIWGETDINILVQATVKGYQPIIREVAQSNETPP